MSVSKLSRKKTALMMASVVFASVVTSVLQRLLHSESFNEAVASVFVGVTAGSLLAAIGICSLLLIQVRSWFGFVVCIVGIGALRLLERFDEVTASSAAFWIVEVAAALLLLIGCFIYRVEIQKFWAAMDE